MYGSYDRGLRKKTNSDPLSLQFKLSSDRDRGTCAAQKVASGMRKISVLSAVLSSRRPHITFLHWTE